MIFHSTFFKPFLCLLLVVISRSIWSPVIYAEGQVETKSSKEHAFDAALLATEAFTLIKQNTTLNDGQEADRNIDSAAKYMSSVIFSMDEALKYALKKDSLAISYAKFSKELAEDVQQLLLKTKQEKNIKKKQTSATAAMNLCKKAVKDAYDASYFFTGKDLIGQKKDDAAIPKQISKLEIDEALFSILLDDLDRKKITVVKENSELTERLKTKVNDHERTVLLNQQTELNSNLLVLQNRIQETQDKLDKINLLIQVKKNKDSLLPAEETIFSKSIQPGQIGSTNANEDWGKQILLDVDIPAGLIYKVQIGVYKNPVYATVFKGLTPVFAQRIAGGGVRYTVGIFTVLGDAWQAKDYIKSMGLADAFVIAYYNGKKSAWRKQKNMKKSKNKVY